MTAREMEIAVAELERRLLMVLSPFSKEMGEPVKAGMVNALALADLFIGATMAGLGLGEEVAVELLREVAKSRAPYHVALRQDIIAKKRAGAS